MALKRLRPLVLLALLLPLLSIHPASAASFSFNWTGTPTAPQPWVPGNDWQLSLHDRDFTQTFDAPYPFQAQHGSDCSGFEDASGNPRIPAGLHNVTIYAGEAFICNNHMMTAVNGLGYAEATFTPAQLVDFSSATATVKWRQSTRRTSCRDWLSYNLMPFADNLQQTDGFGVDLYGEPKNEVILTSSASCAHKYDASVRSNFAEIQAIPAASAVTDWLAPSSNTRSLFELDISRTHLKFWLPELGKVLTEGDFTTPLGFSQAVFQFAQHSYDPPKECSPNPVTCAANTWHWSDFSISNAQPFTILNADRFQVDARTPVVHFAQPAPANAFLRFEELSLPGSMKVTTQAGLVVPVTRQQSSEKNQSGALTDGQVNLVFLSVPEGTTSLSFAAQNVYWSSWVARNLAIWSQSAAAPIPTPTPTPTPTATPSLAPIPISDLPCTVTLPAGPKTGTCTGTLVPSS